MKRRLGFILMAVIAVLLFAQPALAAQTRYQDVLNDVNKTNDKIEGMTNKAINEADAEIGDAGIKIKKYQAEIGVLQEDMEKAKSEMDRLETAGGDKEYNKAKKEVDKLGSKIEKLYDKIAKVESKLNQKLDKIIIKLIDDVDKAAMKTIKKAAKKGFTVYCEYIEVEIGGRVVLIDPLIIADY